MKHIVLGAKKLRLNYLINYDLNRTRLVETLTGDFSSITEVLVTESGSEFLAYQAKVGEENSNLIKIPKYLVDEYNEAILSEDDQADTSSLESLVSHMQSFVEDKIRGNNSAFGDSDVPSIITVSGTKEKARFIYAINEGGLPTPATAPRHKYLTTERTDISLKLVDSAPEDDFEVVDGVVVITDTLSVTDVLAAIGKAVRNTEIVSDPATYEDFSDPTLFDEDVLLPVTHFKYGKTYVAKVCPCAFDYFGDIPIKFVQGDEPLENSY